MVAEMAKNYEKSEFKDLPNCLAKIDASTDYVSDSTKINDLSEAASDQRLVLGCIADNCRLPFEDSSFDCYISNLSMMIVPDYTLQI